MRSYIPLQRVRNELDLGDTLKLPLLGELR
jgi:hypothetical protein